VLGHATDRAEALQASYNSSEQELVELRFAALETCQAVEEGEAQAGSSLAGSSWSFAINSTSVWTGRL
jgi:hypothetical protein